MSNFVTLPADGATERRESARVQTWQHTLLNDTGQHHPLPIVRDRRWMRPVRWPARDGTTCSGFFLFSADLLPCSTRRPSSRGQNPELSRFASSRPASPVFRERKADPVPPTKINTPPRPERWDAMPRQLILPDFAALTDTTIMQDNAALRRPVKKRSQKSSQGHTDISNRNHTKPKI
ncbi:hypothetical protein N658DRAFT_17743 [Parathielavia hyrcaniae]|uniref:Uncharacterized protein n=1 Tax=Parathielavia hyrcaniae TaxID=113614 RepID=A0AAN6QA18_9PEZI|nr:hypothetical protein N658DRAFT_17743 [Parathielavia hyrcaniae]